MSPEDQAPGSAIQSGAPHVDSQERTPTIDDPQTVIQVNGMTNPQIIAIAIATFANATEGFDAIAISYAAPGVTREFGLSEDMLGVVLAMELIGMAIGSLVFGGLADRIGRRTTMIACLCVMSLATLACAAANGIVTLLLFRIITGLSIGAMIPALTALVAETANEKSREIAIGLIGVGATLGAIFGGWVAAFLLEDFGWRAIFLLGGGLTASATLLVILFVPETVVFLLQRRPKRVLERINGTIARLRLPGVAMLPEQDPSPPVLGMAALFAPVLRYQTIIVTCAFLLHIVAYYFLLKWLPKIMVDLGSTESEAAERLATFSIGGLLGTIAMGFLARWLGIRTTIIAILVMSTVALVIFGFVSSDLDRIAFIVPIIGFFTTCGVIAFYAYMASIFPPQIRTSGIGFVLGVGRAGAAIAPIIVGYLFAAGLSVPIVVFVIGAGSTLAAALLLLDSLSYLRRRVWR